MSSVRQPRNRATAQPRNKRAMALPAPSPRSRLGTFPPKFFSDARRHCGKDFVLLTINTAPDYSYVKTTSAGQRALWKYKVSYLQADQRARQWSDAVSIPVAE
jgi:hypothetical protein